MRATLAAVLIVVTASVATAQDMRTPPSFAGVADAVRASVVSVVLPSRADDEELTPDAIFRQLFDVFDTLPHRILGAAVVLRPDVAVTGGRLLRGLTELDVVTVDGRHFRARVVGLDERTDLAVLRVDAPAALVPARLGDSDEMRVGDWVLAVGSPYGFEASVSAGIVSARARAGAVGEASDLIQTDAAINPGSAGGPLVSTRAEVVAVAVAAAPRGSGIGFAVPSNRVRTIVADILIHGKVMRSWLGLVPQPLTPELARAFRAPSTGGLLLSDVVAGGPAARAGIARGAILLATDAGAVRSLADLERALARVTPGQTLTLLVWRNGRQDAVRVRVGDEPTAAEARAHAVQWLGLTIGGVTPEVGVLVTEVKAGSPAGLAGILRGDLVRELDGHVVRTVADFDALTGGLRTGRLIPVLVQRANASFYLALDPER